MYICIAWILVMLRYIENIKISVRYRYIVSYRIARRNIEIFDIPVSTFWYTLYHLAEFSRAVSRNRDIFIETLTEFFHREKISWQRDNKRSIRLQRALSPALMMMIMMMMKCVPYEPVLQLGLSLYFWVRQTNTTAAFSTASAIASNTEPPASVTVRSVVITAPCWYRRWHTTQ